MQEILDTYRNGDMSVRTNLFLTYRDLREEFMAIEMDEEATPCIHNKAEGGNSLPRRLCAFLNLFGVRF